MNWRRSFPVLVTDAHTMGSLAVVRSLGRAGYPVIAASPHEDAPAFRSRYCNGAAISPEEVLIDAYCQWLRRTIAEHGITAIVPSEGALLAIRGSYREFAHLLPYRLDEATLYRGLSKADLFAVFAAEDANSPLRANLPPFVVLDERRSLPAAAFRSFGSHVFAKADACYAHRGSESRVIRLRNDAELPDRLARLLVDYSRFVVQGEVPGKGVGVFLLRWKGRVLARFGHRRVHEVPHTGGASSLREAWWHEPIYEDAALRLAHLGWEGVAMLEYRWDASDDRFYLLEMNGRFWGSLHLALYSGVDFPRLLIDAMHGREETCMAFERGVRSRWTFPREVEYVFSRLGDKRLPLASRLCSVLEFVLLSLDPRIKSELFFRGDALPGLKVVGQSIPKLLRTVISRIGR
jgi:predicted ATP-grasp superfamily ATP-dependent carboligase